MMFVYSPFQAGTSIALTATTTATAIPNVTTKYVSYTKALFTVEGGPVRVGFGGLTPTSTSGHKFGIGDSLTFEGWADIQRFKYIRQGATNGTIWFTPFKYQT